MNAWKPLLLVPVVAAFALPPQDPPSADPLQEQAAVTSMSELRYVTLQGDPVVVPAKNVVEIRLLEDVSSRLRLELVYENGDYSLIDAQAFHLLRNGPSAREVRLVRGKASRMRFPRMP